MQTIAKYKEGWVVCGICNHKLGRITGKTLPTGIEIKCGSCKTLNLLKGDIQYTVPHCEHCVYYHAITGRCIQRMVKNGNKGLRPRKCGEFTPSQEYEYLYKEMIKK